MVKKQAAKGEFRGTVKNITFKEIKDSISVLFGRLANHNFTDPKALYRITKLVNKLRPDAIFIEKELEKIFKKYAKPSDDKTPNSPLKLPESSVEAHDKEKDALLAIISEAEIQPIEFSMIQNVGLSPNDITNLGRFLLEPEEV